jgi:hypothetical protein
LKSKLVARKQGRCAQKASAQLFRIADFEFFRFSFSIRIPQSAFRNLVSRLDTRPGLWNIDTNDLIAGGWVHKDFPDAFCT